MKHLNKIVEDFTSQSFSNDSKKSALALAISCLELMESILSWPFGHSTDKSKLITLVPTDIDDAKTIDLPLEWKETFLIHVRLRKGWEEMNFFFNKNFSIFSF